MLDGTSPDIKTAEVVPVYKKKKRTDKNNDRPVSILSNTSKIYEWSFYNQMYDYFDRTFSRYQYGFRKGHSPQHCLLYMTEKLNKQEITITFLLQFLQTSVKHLIASTMNLLLPVLKITVGHRALSDPT